jgi:hypothetical protein
MSLITSQLKNNIPYADESILPSIESINSAFESLRSIDFSKAEYAEIKKTFFEHLSILPQVISLENEITIPIFRISDGSFKGFDKCKIDSFSHPHIGNCSEGRANIKNHPVFYSSFSEQTSLIEFSKKEKAELVNKVYYLSEWKINDNVRPNVAHLLYDESLDFSEPIADLNKSNHIQLEKLAQSYSLNKRNAFKLLSNKLSNFFVSNDIKISSFIGHYLLYDCREESPLLTDILLYPSIQERFAGVNLALHPEFVKNHVSIKKVLKVEIENIIEEDVIYKLLEVGLPINNQDINWYIPKKEPAVQHVPQACPKEDKGSM